jgi:hypothetical protein
VRALRRPPAVPPPPSQEALPSSRRPRQPRRAAAAQAVSGRRATPRHAARPRRSSRSRSSRRGGARAPLPQSLKDEHLWKGRRRRSFRCLWRARAAARTPAPRVVTLFAPVMLTTCRAARARPDARVRCGHGGGNAPRGPPFRHWDRLLRAGARPRPRARAGAARCTRAGARRARAGRRARGAHFGSGEKRRQRPPRPRAAAKPSRSLRARLRFACLLCPACRGSAAPASQCTRAVARALQHAARALACTKRPKKQLQAAWQPQRPVAARAGPVGLI